MLTFDANILFYAFDEGAVAKRRIAADILDAADLQGVGFLTLQALGEFVHAAVRKNLLSRSNAVRVARTWADIFHVSTADAEAFDTALVWWEEGRQSYWDALLVATASRAGASALVTEDFADGAVFAGVEILNPFAEGATQRLKAHGLLI